MLLIMAQVDELTCGFLVIALPLLRDRLHLSDAEAGLLFTVGALESLLVEPVINTVSDMDRLSHKISGVKLLQPRH
jgi:hypothetical protein